MLLLQLVFLQVQVYVEEQCLDSSAGYDTQYDC